MWKKNSKSKGEKLVLDAIPVGSHIAPQQQHDEDDRALMIRNISEEKTNLTFKKSDQ